MNITEVRITREARDQFKGYASVVFDGVFVVHDLKIIEGTKGVFVSMPSKKRTDRCFECLAKVEVTHNYCHRCGKSLPPFLVPVDNQGTYPKVYKDVCHPINNDFRGQILAAVLKAFDEPDSPITDYLCPSRDS